MERTVTLFENGKHIFGLKRRVDTRNNNLEEMLADFIMQMDQGKGMINAARVANIIRIRMNRHSVADIIGVFKNPDDWRVNQNRPLPDEEIDKIESIKERAKEASTLVRS